MRRKVALLYTGIGLTVIVHLVVLTLLNYDSGSEAEEEAAPWRVRNAGAQRNIHLVPEGELVVKARSLSQRSPAEHQKPKTFSPTLGGLNAHLAASSELSSNLHHVATDSSSAVSQKFGSPSVEAKSKPPSTEVLDNAVSKERWERLKPPSMLLDSKDEREKLEFIADTQWRDSWMKERRQQSALAELANKRVQKVQGKASPTGLTAGKPDQTKKPTGDNNGGGFAPENRSVNGQMKAPVVDALEEERKRAESTNKKWKERRKRLESGKKFEEGDYTAVGEGLRGSLKVPTLDQYFQEVCEDPPGPLVECSETPLRKLSEVESLGDDIMLSIRTTVKYHDTRLPVLLDTWLGEVEPTNVFIVTDGEDEDLLWKTNTLGMHYVNIHSGQSHNQSDLCCKAGVELELLMAPQNSKYNWICHIDDDMYVNLKSLVRSLAHFDPRTDKVYYGRSGALLEEPRQVKNVSTIGRIGSRYFFAVGGMYCLSRAMLEAARPYLVGCKTFENTCLRAQEPEDVTVGLVVGAVLNQRLQWTGMIYSHGLDLLSSTPTPYLSEQVAFSYGFGASGGWNIIPNVVYVPGAIYNIDEDITQFRSLHCHLHPTIQWCLDKKKQLLEEKKKLSAAEEKWACDCSWKKVICCQVYKENYAKWMHSRVLELRSEEKKKKELEKTARTGEELQGKKPGLHRKVQHQKLPANNRIKR